MFDRLAAWEAAPQWRQATEAKQEAQCFAGRVRVGAGSRSAIGVQSPAKANGACTPQIGRGSQEAPLDSLAQVRGAQFWTGEHGPCWGGEGARVGGELWELSHKVRDRCLCEQGAPRADEVIHGVEPERCDGQRGTEEQKIEEVQCEAPDTCSPGGLQEIVGEGSTEPRGLALICSL